jgi:hypothetical protein
LYYAAVGEGREQVLLEEGGQPRLGTPGERMIKFHEFIRIYRKHARQRWEILTGDPHDDHHVTIGCLAEVRAGCRWYVYSTHLPHRLVWAYPRSADALRLVNRLQREYPGSWLWTEVTPTPYDAHLGTLGEWEDDGDAAESGPATA